MNGRTSTSLIGGETEFPRLNSLSA